MRGHGDRPAAWPARPLIEGWTRTDMTACSPLATAALEEGLALLADVRHVRLDGDVARLTMGRRPTVWINPESSMDARCRAMLDALRVLALGPEHALDAQHVPHLRLVI